MALSWTQDRLGPICRYAEDCAIVMQAIAKPDGRDMSVSDMPFNWDATLDIKTLKVGYIKESFDSTHERGCERRTPTRCPTTLLRSAGVSTFVPMTIPAFTSNVAGLGVGVSCAFLLIT